MRLNIAIIEDERINRVTLETLLQSAGHTVKTAEDGISGMEMILIEKFDLIITDINLPGYNGLEILQAAMDRYTDIPVIMMTGYATVKNAVDCLKIGAYEYLTKPFQPDELLHIVSQIGKLLTLNDENRALKVRLAEKGEFPEIIGNSDVMKAALEKVKMAAPGDSTILLQGESGTGKEIFADAIQRLSSRANTPFVKLNCSALNESLFESEMFGHEKGSFTGALQRHIGRFERADSGTIFLDDIDDLSPAMQTKLLRVFQEREIERVGGKSVIPVNVRIISATKANLKEKVERDEFREDFYYRLGVVTIHIPALRERRSDVPLLANHFLEKYAPGKNISPELMKILVSYHWPGNVREFQNVIEQMSVFSKKPTLDKSRLPDYINTAIHASSNPADYEKRYDSTRLDVIMDNVEIELLKNALDKCKGNQQKVAEYLGIPRTTLRSKLQKYRLVNSNNQPD
ncbi:MAG: sigma-54-dependent Fis family transcriptional regulator [FCB group bacterium]|nr:sigma-54-dependent Fis family transcriptional regulator [FCB group bacterium]